LIYFPLGFTMFYINVEGIHSRFAEVLEQNLFCIC